MDGMTLDELRRRIADIQAERDALVAQANQQIAFLNGKLAAYQEWLERPAALMPAEVIAPPENEV